MKSCILECRTVSIVRDLKVEQRQGANGAFESKDILFRIAVDRDYKVTRQDNGKTISEYPTDFWLAKATGPVAQIFADHCTATKEDGKLISRHLLVSGSFENYTNTRKVKVNPQVNIGGQLYQLDLEVEVPSNNTIFVIDSIKFLDSNPANKAHANGTTVATAVATPVPVAVAPQTPVAPQTQPVAPVAETVQPVASQAPVVPQVQPVAQPVEVSAPVAPQAQTVAPQAPVVETAQPVVPVVDPSFQATGQVAPF